MIETFWRWIYRFDNSSLMELIEQNINNITVIETSIKTQMEKMLSQKRSPVMLNSFEFTIGDDKNGSNVNAPANDVQVEIPINGNGVDDVLDDVVTGGLFVCSSNSNVNTLNTSNSKCKSVTVPADDPIANKVTETFIGSSNKQLTISYKLKNYPFAL